MVSVYAYLAISDQYSHVHMLCINAPSFHFTHTDFHSMAYYLSFSILRWMVDIHSFFGDTLEQFCYSH